MKNTQKRGATVTYENPQNHIWTKGYQIKSDTELPIKNTANSITFPLTMMKVGFSRFAFNWWYFVHMPLLLGLLAFITFHSIVLYKKFTNQEACTNLSGAIFEEEYMSLSNFHTRLIVNIK